MAQTMGSVFSFLVVVLILAIFFFLCGGFRAIFRRRRDPGGSRSEPVKTPGNSIGDDTSAAGNRKGDKAYPRTPPGRGRPADGTRPKGNDINTDADTNTGERYDQSGQHYDDGDFLGSYGNNYAGFDRSEPDGTGRTRRPVSWGFEIIQTDQSIKSYYHIPDCSRRDVTVGSGQSCVIRIMGDYDMCDEHIIIRRDDNGVFFVASDKCTEDIIVNGRIVFLAGGKRNEKEKIRRLNESKTYLSEGMKIELGSAMVRVVRD